MIIACLGVVLISSCKIQPEIEPTVYESSNQRGTQGIERDLEYLTYGLAMAHHALYDTLAGGQLYNPISNIIYRKASRGVTDYYAATYEYIFNEAEAIGIELDTMMNAYIRAEYNISDSLNIVRQILANNYHNGTYYSFHLVFPFLDNYVNLTPDSITELIPMTEAKFALLNSKRPVWTWSYTDKSYPLDGYGVTGLGSWEELGDVMPSGLPRPMAVSAVTPLSTDLYITDDDMIIECNVEEILCKECPYIVTSEPLSDVGGASGTAHDEVVIILQDPAVTDSRNCFNRSSIITEFNGEGPYAILRSMEEFQYYYASPGVEYRTLTIVDDPIESNISEKTGKYLTMCGPETILKVVGESGGDYNLARGGVYMLSIPSVTSEPVYFSYPFAERFWYNDGPDYKFRYLLSGIDGDACYIWPEYDDVTGSKGWIQNTFSNNIFDPDNTRYLLTTNKDEILNYWKDNWVYVAISGPGGGSAIQLSNMIAAEAESSPEEPAVPEDLGALLGNLNTIDPVDYMGYTTKSFVIIDEFIDEEILYPFTELIIKIDAEFENGEVVNDYYYLTLSDESTSYKLLRLFFRGALDNIEVSVYEVE